MLNLYCQRHVTACIRLCLIVLSLLWLAACASGTAVSNTATLGQPRLAAPEQETAGELIMPPFPSDTDLRVSDSHKLSSFIQAIDGPDHIAQSGQRNYDDNSSNAYVICPGDAEPMAYALYRLSSLQLDRPSSWQFNVSAAPAEAGGSENLPLNYYVGVANYSTYRWDWTGPLTEGGSLVLNSADVHQRYTSAGNVLSMVVVTYPMPQLVAPTNEHGLTAARIEGHVINLQSVTAPAYFDTAPHYAAIDSGTSKSGSVLDPSQFVTLHWDHVTDPSDNYANEADMYEIRRMPTGGSVSILLAKQTAQSGENAYVDDGSDGSYPVTPGQTYIYYLRAENESGYSAFDQRTVTIPLMAPTALVASDGDDNAVISLSWTKAEGATGYKVYRDGQAEANLITTIGDLSEWDDPGVTDYDTHSYSLRSINMYNADGSAFSNSDSGYRREGPTAVLEAAPLAGNIPLTVNFDGSGSFDPDGGGIVRYDWDFNGDGTFELPDGGDSPVHVYNTGGDFDATMRIWDDENMWSTASQQISVNALPVASLLATPLYGLTPLPVDFDASGSTDAGGSIADYEWDFDGDGTFNEAGAEADARGDAMPTYTYVTDGTYEPVVRVTDDDGATDTDTCTLLAGQFPINILTLTTDKTTHCNSAAEPASNLAVTCDSAPTSVDWSASAGVITPSGDTATWEPSAGMPAEKVTVTCTVHNGPSEDTQTLFLYVTTASILTAYGVNGYFVEGAPALLSNGEICPTLEPLSLGGNRVEGRVMSYYMTADHVTYFSTFDIS